MRTYINYEAFELIERRGSITPAELAKTLGVQVDSAASWLSKWTSKGYLKWVPGPGVVKEHRREPGRPRGSGGRYVIGKKWWGELAFDVDKEQG